MSKKSFFFFLFLAALVVGAWFYLANKFERVATEEILPKLERHEKLIGTDMDAVKINKFMFNVELGTTRMFGEHDEIGLYIDSAKIYYNPFTDKLVASIGGEQVTIEVEGHKYHADTPEASLEFDRGLINKNFVKYSLLFQSSNMDFIDDETSKSILSYGNFTLDFLFDKSGDLTLMGGSLDIKQAIVSAELHAAMTDTTHSLFAGSAEGVSDAEKALQSKLSGLFASEEAKNFINKFNQEVGEVDYNLAFEAKLPQALTDSFAASLAGEEVSPLMFVELAESDASIMLTEKFTSDQIISDSRIEAAKEASDVFGKFKIDLDATNLSEGAKDSLVGLYSVIIRDVFGAVFLDEGYEIDDFSPILSQMLDFKKYMFDMNVTGNIDTGRFDLDMLSDVDGRQFKINADSKDLVTKAEISIDNFGNMLNKMLGSAKSLAKVVGSKKTSEESQAVFAEMIEGFEYAEGHLFKAAKALHEGSDLARDGTLKTNLEFNMMNFDFKVNDKPAFELMNDPRVVEFMQNAPAGMIAE